MSHEPECNVVLLDEYGRPKMPPWTCNCEQIRGAYQRGREDAAEATVPVSRKFNGIMTTYADAVYIAARGGHK